ncbi:amidohydrolase [Evansella cellulosilytica]|uniref:5-methylthioadenosine/S-adenosylhomocysteine deaminase n=1 Tax=Evansella cellulosilytica (strain ATCC 21833 / DSM 2522 / FERM P-1141 / JCM 9156 / N-4) TaxID=649639 RepID=E6TZJ7_EVAC2|nr:amidohydrolase [Evansella cellulosilytica]ADU30171.1 amidohydrolase [Evansella cellulosilytica DSM 2522]
MVTVIHSITIITLDENNAIFQGFVIIKGGTFQEVGSGYPSKKILDTADEVINGKGKWMMPGLVNTHGHLGSTYLRGAGDDIPLMNWLENVMWPAERRFTRETVLQAASLAILEMVKSGTTTFLDMYHLHMDNIAELVIESDMRAVLCRGMIGHCSDQEQEEKLLESIQLYHNFHGENDNKLTVALSPHAPYTCPPVFLEKVVDKAVENGMWIHTHVSETKKEVVDHIQKYGKRPVEHLNELGMFNVPCLIAHAVHVNDEELNILKEKGVSISHNPMSNLKLGSGIAPIPKMLDLNLSVSLGTDSTASNNNLDMFEELRIATLIQKGLHEDPTITSSEAYLRMATQYGAKSLQINNVGEIKENFIADFILIEPEVPHLLPWNEDRIISHIVYSMKGSDVTDSFVQGKQIMRNRELLQLDEEKILYEANCYLKS